MEFSPKQQTTELIKKSNQILVTSSRYPTGDAIGSILALGLALKKMGKEVTLVSSEFKKESFKFLPALFEIKSSLKSSNDLIMSLNTTKTKVFKLSYNNEGDKLNIIITPKEGSFVNEDVSINKDDYQYDLVIILDTSDVEHIDRIYDENTGLFFETPIINIDHKAGNEYFGAVNLIDLTATSTAEILVSVIESLDPGLLDADVATCLLTGIITETTSFKNPSTTPKSLTIAAQLLALGARQQEIVQHLYKTKPLRVLKLLGKIFSKTQIDPETHLVWSSVTNIDLKESGADLSDLNQVADEFAQITSNSEIILLLVEKANSIIGKLRYRKGYNILPLIKMFSGQEEGEGITFFLNDVSLDQAEKEVKDKISNFKLKRSGSQESQDELKSEESFKIEKQTREKVDLSLDSENESPKVEKKDREWSDVDEEEVIPLSKSGIVGKDSETEVSVWRADEENLDKNQNHKR